ALRRCGDSDCSGGLLLFGRRDRRARERQFYKTPYLAPWITSPAKASAFLVTGRDFKSRGPQNLRCDRHLSAEDQQACAGYQQQHEDDPAKCCAFKLAEKFEPGPSA